MRWLVCMVLCKRFRCAPLCFIGAWCGLGIRRAGRFHRRVVIVVIAVHAVAVVAVAVVDVVMAGLGPLRPARWRHVVGLIVRLSLTRRRACFLVL